MAHATGEYFHHLKKYLYIKRKIHGPSATKKCPDEFVTEPKFKKMFTNSGSGFRAVATTCTEIARIGRYNQS
jgi:hypothetical protein